MPNNHGENKSIISFFFLSRNVLKPLSHYFDIVYDQNVQVIIYFERKMNHERCKRDIFFGFNVPNICRAGNEFHDKIHE